MSSKVSLDTLYEAVREVLHGSQRKRRKFLEMVELQISLKNYDPQKDKRFSVSCDTLYETVQEVLHGNQHKCQNVLEMVDLQIGLKNCDLKRTDTSQHCQA
uniref:Uncharacterized protein n=1 Tax=Capra hircus TaxID=9925 RepID=A0A8C2R240_CAPHI